MKINIIIIIFLACIQTIGQKPLDTNRHAFKDQKESFLIFIDSTSSLPIESIPNQNFVPLDSVDLPRLLTKDYLYHFYLKIILKNSTQNPQTLLVTAGDMLEQKLFFVESNVPVYAGETNQKLTEKFRPYKYDYRYIKFEIGSGQQKTLIIQFSDLPGKDFILKPKVLSQEEDYSERLQSIHDHRLDFFLCIILYGILAYLLIVVLIFYGYIKKRYLLYYSGYLFFMLLFHLYGFSNSPFTITPLNLIPFFKTDLRQNFYILGTQIFYLSFLSEFMQVRDLGNKHQKAFFKSIKLVFVFLLLVELLVCFVFKRYDWQFLNASVSGIFIILTSVYLIIKIFRWKNLYILPFLKAATIILFIGVIYGIISSWTGIVKTSSDLWMYYPNHWFNLSVFLEVIFYTLAILQEFFRTRTEQIRLQKQTALTELSLLRSQINPHFLFNTLNSIKSFIIQKETREATEFLTDFSDLIRTILEKSREQVTNLKDELDFCERYLQIEQKRFLGQFSFQIDRDLNIDLHNWSVPAFLLQPYLENSIKHGFNGIDYKGIIKIGLKIKNQKLVITIEDNGIGRESAQKRKPNGHNSMGEKLIENRLELISKIYEWKIKVNIIDLYEPTGTRVVFVIPKLS